MEQFSIFYFFIALIVGFGLLSISFFVFIKQNKSDLLKKFLYFYSTFSTLSFLNLFSDYYKFNIIERNKDLYTFLRYLENPVFLLLVMYTVTIFIHEFVTVENKDKRNKTIGIITIAVLIINYSISLFPKVFTSDISRILIKDIVFVIVLFYNFYLLIVSYKKETNNSVKSKLFYLLVILAISLPCVVSDTFFLEIVGFKMFPIVYILLGGYFVYYLLSENANSLTNEDKEIKVIHTLQHKYSLTEREIEVALLVIKGDSYKEIAEKLFISINTVKSHLQNIYQKTDSANKMQLVNKLTK